MNYIRILKESAQPYEHLLNLKMDAPRRSSRREQTPWTQLVSMRSDWSMDHHVTFKDGNQSVEREESSRRGRLPWTQLCLHEERHQERSKVPSAQSVQQYPTELIQRAEEDAHAFLDKELKKLWRVTSQITHNAQRSAEEDEGRRWWMNISAARCQHKLKSRLKEKTQRVFEGVPKAGQATDLNEIYTEIFITEGHSGDVNQEHEVRLIETASRKPAKEETPIKCEDILKPLLDKINQSER
ncbi:hypothetical protein N1851_026816 [Merluccius polli]|uniref:FISNA domain-containing protein n=1 Tax=Merluccius polli TaxID=89951 RepID=A0AA47NTP2_MERPO|nr:hypothetical protein N1851_026816 [Merluccius polli]